LCPLIPHLALWIPVAHKMTQVGTVKLFNPDKGFGFITAADGSDVFLHIKGCADEGVPQKGDVVAYDVGESKLKPGQMQASNITGGTGTKGGGKGGPPGANSGQCKSFNAEKGFGFIIGEDGKDLFFHVKGMSDGSTPQAGDALTFDLEPSRMKPGEVQAQNIRGGTGWDAGKGGKGGKGGFGAAKGGWGGDAWGGDAWGGKGKGDGWGGDSWGGKGGPYGGKDGGKGGKMMKGWGGGDGWGGGGDAWGGKGW